MNDRPRWEWLTAFLLTACAACVHAVRALHAGPLWRDEAGALAIAQLPNVRQMLHLFPHEAFPLAFPLTLRGWLILGGDSDPSLRWFGAAVAALLLAALWLNARAAGTLPLASLALFVLSPLSLLVAAVRGYGLASAAVVLAVAAHARLMEGVDRRRLVAAGAAALFAAHVALHDAALLLAIGVAAAVVAFRRGGWRGAVAILGADAVAALSLLIYVNPLTAARQWDRSMVENVTWRSIGRSLAGAVEPDIARLYAVAAAVGILAAVLALRKGSRDRTLFYLLCLALMWIAYGVWLQVLSYAPRNWYFVPLLAGSAACLDGLLASRERPRLRFALTAGALAAAIWLLPRAWSEAHLRSTNVDLVANELARAARPGDLVVVNPWFFGISFARYYRGAAPWTTVPPLSDRRMHRYDLVLAYMKRPETVSFDRVAETLHRGGTVWLVGFFEPPATEPMPLPPAPHPVFGWADAPYLGSWSQQLAALLTKEGELRRDEIPLNGPTSGFEAMALREFRARR